MLCFQENWITEEGKRCSWEKSQIHWNKLNWPYICRTARWPWGLKAPNFITSVRSNSFSWIPLHNSCWIPFHVSLNIPLCSGYFLGDQQFVKASKIFGKIAHVPCWQICSGKKYMKYPWTQLCFYSDWNNFRWSWKRLLNTLWDWNTSSQSGRKQKQSFDYYDRMELLHVYFMRDCEVNEFNKL